MNFLKSQIISNQKITEDLYLLTLEYSCPVSPGQFVMIKVPDSAYILPRPISIFDYDTEQNILSLLIRKRGNGTHILSQLASGDIIEIFGSLGKGFDTSIKNKNIILMGGGEGIAPMLIASKFLMENNTIQIFAGFRYQTEAKILEYFNQRLNIQYTSQDYTEKKLITELLDNLEEPDYIYTCGPIPMMQAIYQKRNENSWLTKVYVSMESHMACGVGACVGCTVKNSHNISVKTCTEGPVFQAEEIFHV